MAHHDSMVNIHNATNLLRRYRRRPAVANAVIIGAVAWAWLGPRAADARPPGPEVFCSVYGDAPLCVAARPSCTLCHTSPPARNAFGVQLAAALAPDIARPLDDAAFAEALPEALRLIEALDADGDGIANGAEITAGTDADDPGSVPAMLDCAAVAVDDAEALRFNVCDYDGGYALYKVHMDVCGAPPSRQAMRGIAGSSDPRAAVREALADCVSSGYWRGRDGVLWNMANRKIVPDASIKSGEDAGDIPLADYEDDYNLFVYTQIDGRDARELLTADYFVARQDPPSTGDSNATTVYTPFRRSIFEDLDIRGEQVAQLVSIDRRAGMLTTRWFLSNFVMFTAIPRTAAAQAYRSYLGYDIAQMEGLQPIANEPEDYDVKGVGEPACAECHATLDPMTYPFAMYEGLGGGNEEDGDPIPGIYNPLRLERFIDVDGPRVLEVPESGWLLGQEVADLREWGTVAASSDAFARATVADYWRVFFGEDPRPDEVAEFTWLWQRFADEHNYSVDAMLADLVTTEAYGVP